MSKIRQHAFRDMTGSLIKVLKKQFYLEIEPSFDSSALSKAEEAALVRQTERQMRKLT